MTRIVLTELLGGRVLEIDDLDPNSLDEVGDGPLSAPSGPARHPDGRILAAEMSGAALALAEPGDPWRRLGSPGSGIRELDRPAATAFRDDAMLVLDAGNCRVVSVDHINGSGWTEYGHRGRPTPADPAEGAFADPRGLAVDSGGRIWVGDPGAARVTRIDSIDGDGWTEIPLPAAAAPPLPLGLAALGDGVAILDAANRRLVVLDGLGGTDTIDLGGWVAPGFVAGPDGSLLIADVVANELRLLGPDGTGGFQEVARLRGSPPDLVDPLFDSLGGVGS